MPHWSPTLPASLRVENNTWTRSILRKKGYCMERRQAEHRITNPIGGANQNARKVRQ